MSEKKKYKLQDYLDYLKGKSSSQEQHELERNLEADPFEREAMEGLETISPEEVEADLLSLHERLDQRLARETRGGMTRRRRIRLYSVAASVASLLIVGSIFLKIHDFNPPTELEMQEQAVREFQEKEAATPPAEKGEAESVTEQDVPVTEQDVPLVALEEPVMEKSPVKDEKQGEKGRLEQASPEGKQDAPPETLKAEEPTALPDEEATEGLANDYIVVEEAEPRASTRKEIRELEVIPEAEMMEEEEAMELPSPVATAPSEKKGLERDKMARTAGFSPEEEELMNNRISGVVLYAEDMEPLPGATVMIKNADTGVSTDMMGRFSLTVKEDTSTLVAAFVGMETEEYQALAGTNNELIMHPSTMSLDEVVVISGMSSDYEDTNRRYSAAEPKEGYWAYRKYIEENIRIPAMETSDKEVVILNFILTADGHYKDFVAVRSPGPEFTDEAIRLIREGPQWKVAENMGGPMDELVRMRIVFKK